MSKQSRTITRVIKQTGKLSNDLLDIRVTDQDRRRLSDKINEIQEMLYAYLYIDKHGMV